jgi:aminoglycoside phosphotransferase family enzyme/predicted kinase
MDAETARDDQGEIIDFLMRPEAYPDAPPEVERLDTHGAMIFLAGSRAYKLKRAVRLSYLDFSTLAKRKAVCERELALNSPTAPKLYKRLVPVTRGAGGGLRLGGAGEPVDWLIEMERFGQDQLFDSLARDGRLTDRLIDALAEVIGRFHDSAPVATDARWPASLAQVIVTLQDMIERWARISGRNHADYGAALQEAFAAHAGLLAARREGGFVRRCHSDLHLKNIVLIDGEPCLFDALEFDEDLGRIDVLYDLAFLVMDLWHRGLRRQANRLFNRYFAREVSELEWAGLAVFPLFLSIRAAIRAMVGVDGLDIAVGEKRHALGRDIADYIDLGVQLLGGRHPRLIAVGGLSGTGKSTVAREIGPDVGAAPGAIILRTDVERKAMRGAALDQRLTGEAYSPERRAEVYDRMFAKAEAVLRSGHSVILDATFTDPAERAQASRLAVRLGVPFDGLWLDAPRETLLTRVAARSGDASDADAAVVIGQIEHAQPPRDWAIVDVSGEMTRNVGILREILALQD